MNFVKLKKKDLGWQTLPHSVKVMNKTSERNKSKASKIFRHILLNVLSHRFISFHFESLFSALSMMNTMKRRNRGEKAIRWKMRIYVHDYAINIEMFFYGYRLKIHKNVEEQIESDSLTTSTRVCM